MARKSAVIRWGGHRVLGRLVVQPRVSWLKEASRGRLTRLSRKAEHTSLILALALTYTVRIWFTRITLCVPTQSRCRSHQISSQGQVKYGQVLRLVSYEYQ